MEQLISQMASSRLPALLIPYLGIPVPKSLTLLTSVLGASSNWLALRFIRTATPNLSGSEITTDGEIKIVLLSFLRDWEFWRDGCRKMGSDITKLAVEGKFAFVDGLSQLFGSSERLNDEASTKIGIGKFILQDIKLAAIEEIVLEAIGTERAGMKVVLIIDGIDFLIAATGVGAQDMGDLLFELRRHVYATIITTSADAPLTHSPQTRLERSHAALLVSLAHQARIVMSLRLLDTGVAKDVSGVLRITKGGALNDNEVGIEEREFLYFVGTDGTVAVFERGA